jgi:hypothetical protein
VRDSTLPSLPSPFTLHRPRSISSVELDSRSGWLEWPSHPCECLSQWEEILARFDKLDSSCSFPACFGFFILRVEIDGILG